MPKAVIVGGTGQIGLAVGKRLNKQGWAVTIISRKADVLPDGLRHFISDAHDIDRLAQAIGSDTDLLMSCVAFDEHDADCLALAGQRAGRIAVISSASVYCDDQRRTLDEAASCGFPVFPVPLTEQSLTVAAGAQNYSTRKVAMENRLISQAKCPVTILRPCAIHGSNSKHAREWWFVKRLLDGRAQIPLAYEGKSRFQTTAVAAIADAVLQAVAGKLPVIANVADADCPSVAQIGQAIMDIMDIQAELVGLADVPNFPPQYGRSPWAVPQPMILSAKATGKMLYKHAVEPAIHWLSEYVTNENWPERLPVLAAYPNEHFDYAADDAALQLFGALAINSSQ